MKRILLILCVILISIVSSLVFWNGLFLERARERIGNYEKKLLVLKRAHASLPFHDQVYFERGKTHYNRGIDNLSDPERRDADLDAAVENFLKAIRLNPGIYLNHYYLAQTLLYKSYFSPSEIDYMSEYLKTSLLNSYDEEIYFDVGRTLLTQWSDLDEKTKDHTIKVLKRRSHFKDENKTGIILQIWAAMSMDYVLMDKILPQNALTFRMYAQFLGERGFSLSERKRKLAEAEYLDFEQAKTIFRQARGSYQRFRLKEAKDRLSDSLKILTRIYFYQKLSDEVRIDEQEYLNVMKSVCYYLFRISLEVDKNMEQVRKHFLDYLILEKDSSRYEDLEAYLTQKKILHDEMDQEVTDLDFLFFRIALDFEQSRFRQIINIGQKLKQSMVLLTDENKEVLHYIYQKVAESYRRLDYLYDARDLFEKSLEIVPDDTEALFGLLLAHKRLNDEEGVKATIDRIRNILSPEEMILSVDIPKGKKFELPLVLDGSEINLSLVFEDPSLSCLVSVFLNDRIIWEGLLDDMSMAVTIQSNQGLNRLSIIPINKSVILKKLLYQRVRREVE